MKTTYEWCAEQVDDCGDIIDTTRHDSRAQAAAEAVDPTLGAVKVQVALVRETGDDLHGMTGRFYAYVRNGRLDRRFSSCDGDDGQPLNDGPDVPKRFLAGEDLALGRVIGRSPA